MISQASLRKHYASLIIHADNSQDGDTFVAPLSKFGSRENEAVFTRGTFTVDGVTRDASGRLEVYLTHHAAT